MTDFLASIHYSQWILHALVLLPLAGAVPAMAQTGGGSAASAA